MPDKKPNSDEKDPKQPQTIELNEEEAAEVRGGADQFRSMDPTNAVPGPLSNLTSKTIKQ